MSFAGQQLGFILRNCYGSAVSRFLLGLSTGLGYPVSKMYLMNSDFSNATMNVQELIKLLTLFRTSPYPPKRTVQIVLTQVDYELSALLRNRPDAIGGNDNLKVIFKQILPLIFEDMFATAQVIESSNLLDRFPPISDVVQEDLELAGARLGNALKFVYPRLTKKASLIEASPLKKLLKRNLQ
eukprot:TRINITY_DN1123_c0_g1_i2.p1 TRINITY_DN1123_c0_g1~~TRINITY_DN1123_c0_g1_i2.p1  ORF type:complete len:183 (+),score=42.14 TRINITY_DN1123_c0_g1_i2:497-1045(+)